MLKTPAGSPAEPRCGHAAALLPDSRALVVVGYDDQDMALITSAEACEPATGNATSFRWPSEGGGGR
jgi:hypothetical protein